MVRQHSWPGKGIFRLSQKTVPGQDIRVCKMPARCAALRVRATDLPCGGCQRHEAPEQPLEEALHEREAEVSAHGDAT